MIKYIKKLIKKQRLLEKYHKGEKQRVDHMWLIKNFNWDDKTKAFFEHQFYCELRCYRRIKNLK